MTIAEVIENLNNGKSLSSIADELGMATGQLKTKLKNAAVEYNEDKEKWEYKGNIASRSLSRVITGTIKRLNGDKPFIKDKVEHNYQNVENEIVDSELLLYTDYLKVHQENLDEKKTFFLTNDLYSTVKKISVEKSLRINPLINLLIQQGLRYYAIEEPESLEKV